MSDKDYLLLALEISKKSDEASGCGCVLVQNDQIIAKEFSSQRTDNVAINHAEIKAVVAANLALGSRKLENTTAYCSCEPCAMCLVALSYAKVERIVYYKRMIDLFPDDPQSRLDSLDFVAGLNFVPKLERVAI